MTAEAVWIAAPAVCRHMRSKMYYMQQGHASGIDHPGGTPCWCMKTMKAMGPDYGGVCEEECVPERECFEQDGV